MPRLDQLLAHNLGHTRKEIARLLRSGAVRDPEGAPLRDPRTPIALDQLPLELTVAGTPSRLREHAHVLLHKPVGVVTSRNDDRSPTAWALLDGAPMHHLLNAVGRLDLDAAGLLLWTTDGQRLHALTHPRRAVPREYQVALARPWTPPAVGEDGAIVVTLADASRPRIVALEPLAEADRHPALEPPPETEVLARITLLDGTYHEVKRIFASLGSHVLRLARVRHGEHALPPDLAAGAWIELPEL